MNSCPHTANSSFAFWNFLEFFFLTIFDLWTLNPWTVNVRLEDIVQDDSLSLLGLQRYWGFMG